MSYAEERLDLFARLRKQTGGRTLSDALRLDGRSLRFNLGTSLADLRVPIHLSPGLEDTFRAAVRDLFYLLTIRHRAVLKDHEYDRLLLLDGFDPRSARTLSFSAPAAVQREGIRKGFLEAPELHPALDSGIVASWISSGRPGRILLGALNALLRRAAEEGARTERKEPTPYLVLLALRKLAGTAQDAVRDLPISGPMGRTFSGAVAAGVLVALRVAMRESGVLSASSALYCEAAALAWPWLSGLRHFWGSGAQIYGPAMAEPVPHLEQHVQKLLAGGTPDGIAREAAAELALSKDQQRKAARAVATAALRGDLLQLLRMVESGRAPTLSLDGVTLPQLYQSPGALERVLGAAPARKDLVARAKTTAKAATNEPCRTLLEGIAAQVRDWKDDEAGYPVPAEAVSRAWSTAVAALAVDGAIDRSLSEAELQLVHRTGGESEGGLETEYEEGKLYMLSLEERPLLRERARAPQMGHLFCDMKDFTKRTAFLKETVVADFLSREFYGPILTAAARYAHGAAHLSDKGGIYLNNLLGDAVSFSGDIVSLVELMHDIRDALGSYARRLEAESSSEQVAHTIAMVEEKYRGRAADLDRALKSARDALARGTLDPVSGEEPSHRIEALHAERQRLLDEREAELALASGEKLEAGIFISYGAAPEVATFEDHVFGEIKVSIAEKINESARGTARSGYVRARIDSLLDQERLRLRRPDLTCPFAVAVSQPLSIAVHGDTEVAVRASIAAGDLEGAEMLLAATVREFIGNLAAQGPTGDRGDIYNGGAALSEDALQAYIAARKSDFIILRRLVRVEDLHPALRDRFVFPSDSLQLVLAVSATSESLQELYVHVGRALFKGFEKQGGLGIFEMIGRENPFFMLLAQHHVARWLADQAAGEDPPSGEWRPAALERGP